MTVAAASEMKNLAQDRNTNGVMCIEVPESRSQSQELKEQLHILVHEQDCIGLPCATFPPAATPNRCTVVGVLVMLIVLVIWLTVS